MKVRIVTVLLTGICCCCLAGKPAWGASEELLATLSELPAPLDTLKSDQFTLSGSFYYSKDISLFGQSATVYLYRGASSTGPVAAVVLTAELTADKLFSVGSALDVGLKSPVFFWTKQGTTLVKTEMPTALKTAAEASGMSAKLAVDSGFNLYGRLASGFVGDLLNTAPINLNPNGLFAGVAKGNEGHTVSLSIAADTPWSKPFGLADTRIKGATVRITSKKDPNTDKAVKTVESWGTAAVGRDGKEFTLYAKRTDDGLSQSLGFDVANASVKDYFLILGVVSETLGLPKIPAPTNLPLDMVTLANPAYQKYADSSPPNFATMMFKGSAEMVNGKDNVSELITNAQGKIFGQEVAEIKLNASTGSGVTGDAALTVGLGPLKAGTANFYLKVPLIGTPGMGVAAATMFGDLDLKADSTGLALDIPSKCLGRPVGFSAHLTDISTKEFPINITFNDCFSAEIANVANGVVDMGEAAASAGIEVANQTAKTAVAVGDVAGKTVQDLVAKRAEAWTNSMKVAAATKNAKDAVDQAVKDAGGTVQSLVTEIGRLDKRIVDLGKEIENLLKQAYAFVSGQLEQKRRDKSNATTERDRKRTERAMAEARLAQAQKAQAAAQNIKMPPGPNLDQTVAENTQPLLAALAQQEVQKRVAARSATLTAALKDATQRKALLKGEDTTTFVQGWQAGFTATFPRLSAANAETFSQRITNALDDAKQSLVAKAVAKKLDDEVQAALVESVLTLPTMAFDMPVRIKAGDACLVSDTSPMNIFGFYKIRQPCSGDEDEIFVFGIDGRVVNRKSGKCMSLKMTMKPAQLNCESWHPFYFDASNGTLNFVGMWEPVTFAPTACVTINKANNAASYEGCQTATKWRLEPVSLARAPGEGAPIQRAPEQTPAQPSTTTNLMPLVLK